jgi:glycosyltransferase involved in cell wall biosynthesis
VPDLHILYDVDGWAYHARARALRKHAPADFTVSMAAIRDAGGVRDIHAVLGDAPVDLMLVLDSALARPVLDAVQARGWRTRVIGAWNRGWPHHLPRLFERYRVTDYMIFNNRDAWERTGRWPDTCVLPNGVDLDVFRVTRPLETRRPRVLWTGSELFRHLKGYDDLILPMRARLEAQGIECDVRLVDSFGHDRWTPEEMAEWYNSGTILVCASETEGTPNPALEAAACGCVVVSTRVGNMPELIRSGVNGYLVERSLLALLEGVEAASARYPALARQMQQDIRPWGWAKRSQPYFALFRELLAADGGPEPARAPRRPDLFEELTVFVTTVGAPTFRACLEHLCRQDCTFRLEVVDHVAPLSAALQQMVETCTTPFYVQVDEDMLLYPHAIRTLWERVRDAGPNAAVVVGNLYDAHLERPIAGVKIFRHEAVRSHPVEGVPDWVASLQQHLLDSGRAVVRMPFNNEGTLGLHGTAWTPEAIYERYLSLARRWHAKAGHLDWFDGYPAIFLERFLADPSEDTFFALMGVVAGVVNGAPDKGREKDFRAYARSPGFEALRRFLDEMKRREDAE